MIISESTFAISAKNGLDKPKNQQNAIINGVAESAAKFIEKKKITREKSSLLCFDKSVHK